MSDFHAKLAALRRRQREHPLPTNTIPRDDDSTASSTPQTPAKREASAPRINPKGILGQAIAVERGQESIDIDQAVLDLPIIDAFERWGKPQQGYKQVGGGEVMVRCPMPEHADRNPSASANTATGLWACHGCGAGGDKFTLAAIHYGVSDYQNGKNFIELKDRIAPDLGLTKITRGRHSEYRLGPAAPPVTPPAPPAEIEPIEMPQVITTPEQFEAEEPDKEEEPEAFDSVAQALAYSHKPSLDWRNLGYSGSFIDTYMDCSKRAEYPTEFAFFAGLMCLSFIANRVITLESKDPVQANLGIVTVAETGVGKTRAFRHAQGVLRAAMPRHPAEVVFPGAQIKPGTGVKMALGVGSGENLIKMFEEKVRIPKGKDPNGETIYSEEIMPVDGVVSFEEFSQFVSKSSATGSTLRERVMAFLDGAPRVENTTNTRGDYYAESPFATIYTSVQPANIAKLVDESDETSGFMNRWIYITGEPKPADYFDVEPLDWQPAVESLTDLRKFWAHQGELVLRHTPEAMKKRAHFMKNTVERDKHAHPIFGRADVIFWKLEVLLAINERCTQVNERIIDKCILLYKYLHDTYLYVSGKLVQPSDITRMEDSILATIEKFNSEEKSSTLRSICNNHKNTYSRSQVEAAVRNLVRTEEVIEVSKPQGTHYFVNSSDQM